MRMNPRPRHEDRNASFACSNTAVASILYDRAAVAGIICLLLQLTIIGWLPAAIWSVYALTQYETNQKIQRALAKRG